MSVCVVGLDLGGTSIKAGVVTTQGPSLRRRVPTPRRRGPNAVVDTVLTTAAELVASATEGGHRVAGVGVACLGVVDEAERLARWSVAVGWRDLPLEALVAERVQLPVVVGHDVRTAALAESTLGAGRGSSSVLFVGIGTGLSAALVVDGRAMPGATWQSGEIGQLPVGPRGPARSNLEQVTSAQALAVRYARATGQSDPVDAAVVVDAVRRGDAVAARIVGEALDELAAVLAVLVSFADPCLTILGGGLSQAGDVVLGPLRARLADALGWREPPPLVAAHLGDQAGWVGAALLAWLRAGLPSEQFPSSAQLRGDVGDGEAARS